MTEAISHTVLYLITARGGSKGVPRKNLQTIGGKSLIAYKAAAAHKSQSCSRLIISSDDQEIIDEARRCGVEAPFIRPAELASDTATSADVVLHAMEWIEKNEGRTYDAVMLLEPSSPFATAQHFDAAVEMMRRTKASLVVGMRETEVSSHFVGTLAKDGSIGGIVDKMHALKALRRQDQETEVTMNGALYLMDWQHFKRTRTIYADPKTSYGMVMPKAYSLEIETKLDLLYGEFLMQHHQVDRKEWE